MSKPIGTIMLGLAVFVLWSSQNTRVHLDGGPLVCSGDTCASANSYLGIKIQDESGIYMHHRPRPETVESAWRSVIGAWIGSFYSTPARVTKVQR